MLLVVLDSQPRQTCYVLVQRRAWASKKAALKISKKCAKQKNICTTLNFADSSELLERAGRDLGCGIQQSARSIQVSLRIGALKSQHLKLLCYRISDLKTGADGGLKDHIRKPYGL